MNAVGWKTRVPVMGIQHWTRSDLRVAALFSVNGSQRFEVGELSGAILACGPSSEVETSRGVHLGGLSRDAVFKPSGCPVRAAPVWLHWVEILGVPRH